MNNIVHSSLHGNPSNLLDWRLIAQAEQDIVNLFREGKIRRNSDLCYAIIDVIKYVAKKASPAEVWRRFLLSQQNGIDFQVNYDYYQFLGQGSKKLAVAKLEECAKIVVFFKEIHRRKLQKKGSNESIYRDNLAFDLNGEVEVLTDCGRIDVLTSTEIIEVKSVKHWKSALGQILVYGHYYQHHKKRIHLYGKASNQCLALIQKHCSRFNVSVTHEQDTQL